jgi:hypothetical protein
LYLLFFFKPRSGGLRTYQDSSSANINVASIVDTSSVHESENLLEPSVGSIHESTNDSVYNSIHEYINGKILYIIYFYLCDLKNIPIDIGYRKFNIPKRL